MCSVIGDSRRETLDCFARNDAADPSLRGAAEGSDLICRMMVRNISIRVIKVTEAAILIDSHRVSAIVLYMFI